MTKKKKYKKNNYYLTSYKIFTLVLIGNFFFWSLRDSKSLKVSRIFLSILADFNSAVGSINLIFPLIFGFFFRFWDPFKCTNTNWYHCHFRLPQLFQLSGKIQEFICLFAFLKFSFRGSLKSRNLVVYEFDSLCKLTLSLIFMKKLSKTFLAKSHWKFIASHFHGQILIRVYTIFQHGQVLISCTISSGSHFPNCLINCCIHSLMMRSTVSSLALYNVPLLFCFVSSIFVLL